jgi:Tol biopolymer transport system component
LNAAATDDGAALSSDELSVSFPSDRNGDFAIYGATRRRQSEPFGLPSLEAELDSPGYEGNVALSSDGREVIFTSDRAGSPAVYRAMRQCL